VKSVSKNEGGIGQVRSLSHEDENENDFIDVGRE